MAMWRECLCIDLLIVAKAKKKHKKTTEKELMPNFGTIQQPLPGF
jgi:hypothetical protein